MAQRELWVFKVPILIQPSSQKLGERGREREREREKDRENPFRLGSFEEKTNWRKTSEKRATSIR